MFDSHNLKVNISQPSLSTTITWRKGPNSLDFGRGGQQTGATGLDFHNLNVLYNRKYSRAGNFREYREIRENFLLVNIKDTCYVWGKKQQNLQLLDVLACNSANKDGIITELSTKISRSAEFASCIACILKNFTFSKFAGQFREIFMSRDFLIQYTALQPFRVTDPPSCPPDCHKLFVLSSI